MPDAGVCARRWEIAPGWRMHPQEIGRDRQSLCDRDLVAADRSVASFYITALDIQPQQRGVALLYCRHRQGRCGDTRAAGTEHECRQNSGNGAEERAQHKGNMEAGVECHNALGAGLL